MTSDKSFLLPVPAYFKGDLPVRTVEIRWARPGDWRDFAFVHTESYRSAYKGIIPDNYLISMTVENRGPYYQQLLNEGIERPALLFVDNKAVGCMTAGASADEDLDDTYGEIYSIYLLNDYCGNGFGKRLFHWGVDRLSEFGYRNVALWVLKENVNALRFYEHIGFRFDGAERSITRGKPLEQVRCQKIIR